MGGLFNGAASCKLQAASCKLQAASCKLQAASCKLKNYDGKALASMQRSFVLKTQ
jgi:hypothetical protein